MKAGKIKGLDPGGSLRANAARIVGVRLDELLSQADQASVPDASVAQHDMRIAAKRLRYVLDVTAACFGPEAEAARAAARDLQSVLGDIHDCDLMLPRVRHQIERLRADDVRAVLDGVDHDHDLDPSRVRGVPNRAAYRGLELLAVHLAARRALLHDRFSELWRSQAAGGTWTALEASLREYHGGASCRYR